MLGLLVAGVALRSGGVIDGSPGSSPPAAESPSRPAPGRPGGGQGSGGQGSGGGKPSRPKTSGGQGTSGGGKASHPKRSGGQGTAGASGKPSSPKRSSGQGTVSASGKPSSPKTSSGQGPSDGGKPSSPKTSSGQGPSDGGKPSSPKRSSGQGTGDGEPSGPTGNAGVGGSEPTPPPSSGGQGAGGEPDDPAPPAIPLLPRGAQDDIVLVRARCTDCGRSFAHVALGGERRLTFTLRSGSPPKAIGIIGIVGDAAADFELDPGTCTNGTEIGRDRSCTLAITFRPTKPGKREASLSIRYRGQIKAWLVRGTGVDPGA